MFKKQIIKWFIMLALVLSMVGVGPVVVDELGLIPNTTVYACENGDHAGGTC